MRINRWWQNEPGSSRTGAAAPPSPAELVAVEGDARALAARWTPRLLVFLSVALVLFWPLDALGDDALADVLAAMRVNSLVLTLSLLAVVTFTPVAKRAPRLFASVAIIGGVFVLGWSTSPAGGLDKPWFHFLSTISALTVFVPVRLGARVPLALATGAAVSVGYFVRSPAYLDHPMLPFGLGQTGFAVLLAIVLGHLLYVRFVTVQVQQRRLAAQRAELTELSASLEAQVAAQTEELRSLTHHLHRSVEHERRVLAGEIHDELGQELTALGYALAAARRRMGDASLGLRAAIEDADLLLARTRDTTRRIVARLQPRVLEQLGLRGAVRWALDDLAKRAQLEVMLAIDGPGLDDLPTNIAHAVFQATVEGLNNIAHHAGARRVEVTLAARNGVVQLVIRDDGRGPSHPPSPGQGLGLVALRERSQAVGGTARWGARLGGGFELEMTVPRPATPPKDLVA